MDAFEIRLRFLDILRKLTSAQSSIQKVSAYAVKNSRKSSDDIWDCIVEECEKGSLNARINIFYALDGLLEASLDAGTLVYLDLLKRDLAKIVDLVVPKTKEGRLNMMSTRQILRSWKTRRVLEPEIIDPVEEELSRRTADNNSNEAAAAQTSALAKFSRNDILRRIEDDRERHKRLRERIWILPAPSSATKEYPRGSAALAALTGNVATQSPFSPSSPAYSQSALAALQAAGQTTSPPNLPGQMPTLGSIEIEFDQLWESHDAAGEEDLQAMKIEAERANVSNT